MDTIQRFANEGTTFLIFILSYNEILFIGWLLGIAEAKLVKKVPIDWGFAVFNFLLIVSFWFITERFVRLDVAKNAWGDLGYSVSFLVLGYGAYKAFLAIMKYGIPGMLKAIRGFVAMFMKLPPEKSSPDDKTDG